MKKNDGYDEIREEIEAKEKRILAEQRRMERALRRKEYLLGRKDRRERTHRLVMKGAAVEHFYPETKDLNEKEFYALVEGVSEVQAVNEAVNTWIAGIVSERNESKEDTEG